MKTGIVFEPVLPAFLLWGLAVLAAALTVTHLLRYRNRFAPEVWGLIGFCRLAVLALLLGVLFRPMFERQVESRGPRLLAVAVDTSRSMNTPDCNGKSRIDEVREKVLRNEGLIRQLSGSHRIRYFAFAERPKPRALVDLTGDGPVPGGKTDIGAAVRSLLEKDRGIDGVLILSDGRDTEGMDPEALGRLARSRSVPLFTCGAGSFSDAGDVAVSVQTPQEFAFVGQETRITASIQQKGYTGQSVEVRFLREEEVLEVRRLSFEHSGAHEVPFVCREETEGLRKFSVETEPLEGEVNPRNNRSHAYVRFTDETVRVLFVEAQPHWDSRFLFKTLREDPALSVDAFFRLSPTRYITIGTDSPEAESGPVVGPRDFRLPATREELSRYDIVILGRDADQLFDHQATRNLQNFILEQGGTLVLARGRVSESLSEPFAAMGPFLWAQGAIGDFRYRITSAGEEAGIFRFGESGGQATVNRLPRLLSATRVEGGKSLAVILATAAEGTGPSQEDSAGKGPAAMREMAVLAYQRYGRGRVMCLNGTGLWRWAILPPSMGQYREAYADFWGEIIRWAISGSEFLPGEEITFRTRTRLCRPGKPIRFHLLVRKDLEEYKGRVEVCDPLGDWRSLLPEKDPDSENRLIASYVPELEGEYEAVLHSNRDPRVLVERFSAYHSSAEDQIVAADYDTLRRLARSSGGEYVELEEIARLPVLLRDADRSVRLEPRRTDLWDNGWYLSGLIALLGIEWLTRRRSGGSR